MKIEEQVLSREQMAHLRLLGVDTSDASMMWYCCNKKWYLQINNELSQGVANVMNRADLFVPAYTIVDLIEKLPKSYKDGSLLINPANNEIDYGEWVYYDGELCELENFVGFIGKSVIDSLYELICWVVEKHKKLIK